MKKALLASTIAFFLFAGVSHAATANGTIETTAYPYLKSEPYTQQGKTYGSVPKGTKLEVLEKTNKYYIKVKYNGQVGYISTKYIKYIEGGGSQPAPAPTPTHPTPKPTPKPTPTPSVPTNPPAQKDNWEVVADRIIAQAKSLQGKVQYAYGKYDVNNLLFDCSSFTAYLYKQQGINLKWGARAQFLNGQEISKSQLRKGDLVFTSTSATTKYTDYKKIGHVGIYIGNGQMIHNVNTTSDVKISSITSGWYKDHYVAAARVIK